MDYGDQILRSSPWDFAAKLKNRLMTRIQYVILDFFGLLTKAPPLDRLFSKFARTFIGSYLYSIKLEVNNACTLQCKMCYVPKGVSTVPFEAITSLLDQVKSCGVRVELLGGEPLLRQDIVEIARYAKEKAHVPFLSMYTNGIGATADISQQLACAGLDAVIVTLISHREAIHDAFTGIVDSWDRTIHGIHNLMRAGIRTYTFTAVHAENHLDVDQIYNFVKHTLGARPLFYQYVPQMKDDPLTISNDTWHRIKHRVLVELNPDHMDFVRKFFMLTGNACSGGNFVLTVKSDGSVQPCPFVSDLPLGNIYKNDIWTIYENRYRDTGLKDFKKIPTECTACSYQSVCSGGCKAGNPLLFGRYSHRDHRCLGSYGEEFDREHVADCIPTFF